MTLDYISDWINNDYFKNKKEKKISVERIADMADYACSVASRNAAKQLEGLAAVRFAELSTWALGRCRDYKLCIDACEFGLSIIDQRSKDIEENLMFLTKSEFTRIKSSAFSKLSNICPDDSNDKLEYIRNRDLEIQKLSNYFNEKFECNQIISLEEWKNIDKQVPKIFQINTGRWFIIRRSV